MLRVGEKSVDGRQAEGKMRKTGVAAAVVGTIAAFAATGALAADMYRGPSSFQPAPYNPVYSWYGPYVGLNLGYQWGSVSNSGAKPGGIAGGIQGGYNWQNGMFVFGGEADFQLSSADDTFAPYKFANPWFGTLRGRAGVAVSNILFYGTAGLAYGRGRVETAALSETNLHFGWVAGAGLEVGLTPNWSARAEYLYVDLTDESYIVTGANNGFQSSVFRLGVNYRF
jgi:outer membrane immunogenic protein